MKRKKNMNIFISHSSSEAEIASEVCDILERSGNQCFLAPRDIRSGYEYAEEIINGIDRSDAVILLLSKRANHSPHVLREIERKADGKNKILTVTSLAGTMLVIVALFLGFRHFIFDSSERIVSENAAVSQDSATDLQVGDTIVFGTYNEEPIAWRVLKISEDGREAVLISRDILTIKAYDAPDSGKYNYDGDRDYWSKDSEASTDMELQARVRGNSDWSSSTIRAWLNSEDEVVKYEGQAPTASAMSELKMAITMKRAFCMDLQRKNLLQSGQSR